MHLLYIFGWFNANKTANIAPMWNAQTNNITVWALDDRNQTTDLSFTLTLYEVLRGGIEWHGLGLKLDEILFTT